MTGEINTQIYLIPPTQGHLELFQKNIPFPPPRISFYYTTTLMGLTAGGVCRAPQRERYCLGDFRVLGQQQNLNLVKC